MLNPAEHRVLRRDNEEVALLSRNDRAERQLENVTDLGVYQISVTTTDEPVSIESSLLP